MAGRAGAAAARDRADPEPVRALVDRRRRGPGGARVVPPIAALAIIRLPSWLFRLTMTPVPLWELALSLAGIPYTIAMPLAWLALGLHAAALFTVRPPRPRLRRAGSW